MRVIAMKEQAVPTAWMIRDDGMEIPCIQHIYGSEDDVEETLYASQWLYGHTGRESTRQLVLRFISAYGTMLDSGKDFKENILREMRGKPYVVLTEEFIHQIGDKLSPMTEDIWKLNQEVCDALNREFLRAR
ncbi:MAG: hypothetical protein LUC41_04780, partial [Clostridiales bacterium]|nr:hypothetical protein [Clostridiales bacterium]